MLKGIDFDRRATARSSASSGPSGSGKSTLLRCVNLLEQPTAGKVFVGGVEMTDPDVDIDAARRGIGMVFQQFNLFPHLTVLGNLTIAAATGCSSAARAEARADRQGQPGAGRADREGRRLSRRSSPAASSSGWRSPGRWRWTRR